MNKMILLNDNKNFNHINFYTTSIYYCYDTNLESMTFSIKLISLKMTMRPK